MTYPINSLTELTGRRMFYRDQYVNRDAYEAMALAKTRLLIDYPFWGFMGLDLQLVECNPDMEVHGVKIPGGMTAATDGFHIFYSADFVMKLASVPQQGAEQVMFLIAHEIYHVIWGHVGAQDTLVRGRDTVRDFDASKWNKAADYFINLDLDKENIGSLIKVIDICYDKKYDGMSSEQIYDALKEEGQGKGEGKGGSGQRTLDVHVNYIPDDSVPEGQPQVSYDEGSGSVEVRINPNDHSQNRSDALDTLQRAAAHVENSGHSAGSIPSHLKRLINDIRKPKRNWKNATRQFTSAVRQTGYSFVRPDKRSFGGAITLPGFRRDDRALHIAMAIDTSGSIGDHDLTRYLGETLGILQSYPYFTADIFCFEGDVDKSTHMRIQKARSGNAQKLIEDYVKTRLRGGGGTVFQSVWDFMRKEKIRPKGLVFFTDGGACDTSWHREGSYCPTLFITVGNPEWTAPFGTTVPYEAI